MRRFENKDTETAEHLQRKRNKIYRYHIPYFLETDDSGDKIAVKEEYR